MNSKKMGILCLSIVLFSGLAFGEGIFLEAKGMFFRPSCSCFLDIYDTGLYFGGEVSYDVWKSLSLWVAVDYFSKTGELSFTREETKLRISPVFIGVQAKMSHPRFRPYGGVGLGYFQFKETNPIGSVEDGNIGYLIHMGCQVKVTGRFFVDVRGSYSRCTVRPVDIEAQLGGIRLGFGVGIEL